MNPSLEREPARSSITPDPSGASTFLRGDWATWRSRAIAYTLSFALLALGLVGLRYLSRDLGPHLSDLRIHKAELLEQAKTLTVEAQTLTSPVKVRDFALLNKMVPFSRAPKQAHSFVALPRALTSASPQNILSKNTLAVETRWR